MVSAVQSEADRSAAKYVAAGRSNAAEGESKSEKMGQLQNQRETTSAIAGAAVAGPNPWSGDWVFEPSDANMLKEGTSPDAAIKEALEKLRAAQNAAGSPIARPNTGSTQPAPGTLNPAAQGEVAALAGMQSDFQVESVGDDVSTIQKPKGRGLDSKGAAGSLSGAEFLSTLQQAKSGQGAQAGNGDGSNPGKRHLRPVEAGAAGALKKGPGIEDESLFSRPTAVKTGGLMNHDSISKAGVMPGPIHESGIPGNRAPLGGAALQNGVPVLTGHVTSGSMAKDRLSSESVNGIGMQIRGFQNVGNGGEIRVRLKPDHLGELNLRVSTRGNQVGLQIQASDERAKKILEDSMSALRDSLATQSLSLGKVEVTLASASMQSSGQQNQGSFDQGQNQNFGQNPEMNLNNGFNSGSSNQGFEQAWNDQTRSQSSAREADYAGIIRSPLNNGAARRQTASAGRLDVIA